MAEHLRALDRIIAESKRLPPSYLVRIVSGPAKGWEYVVTVPPDEVILVAPNPRPGVHGKWMRIPFDGQPWLDEQRYRRGPLPKTLGAVVIPDELLTTDGDIIVNYEVVP